MAIALLYPEPKRGRGNKDDARKGAETASFSYRRLKEARQVLAYSRELFGWAKNTADNFISVFRATKTVSNFDILNLPVSALCLLWYDSNAMPPDEDMITAHHEAGHAVAARVLGVTVKRVRLRPNPLVTVHHRSDRLTALAADGVIAWGGPAAERRFSGYDLGSCWDTDLRNMRTRAIRYTLFHHGVVDAHSSLEAELLDPVIRDLAGRWAAKAERIVEQRWRAIERVARALCRGKGELDQGEIDAMIA